MAEAFRSRRTKSVFVLPSWHRGSSTTSVRLSKIQSFLKRRLARAAMARDAKRQVAWNVPRKPIDTARPAKAAATHRFKGDIQGFCASCAMWIDLRCGFSPLSSWNPIGMGISAMGDLNGNVMVSSPKCIGILPRQSAREAPLLRCESFPHDGPWTPDPCCNLPCS